jgi:two-component system OmpR family response regulator
MSRSVQSDGSQAANLGQPEARLLVVDDEPYIADLIATGLKFVGFDVRTAGSGNQALSVAEEFAPNLLVLDVMLPDLDGFEVCRRLREDGRRVGVVFLTARDATEDKITGLTLGGDDYVTKPFSLEEVVARVRAVLRRTAALTPEGDVADTGRLTFADLELDEDVHEVRRAGEVIDLSPTEFALLRYLMANSGRVLSKAQILDHVWQYDFNGDSGIVESYISYLRKKIDRFDPPLIHTLRGVGYSLRVPRA